MTQGVRLWLVVCLAALGCGGGDDAASGGGFSDQYAAEITKDCDQSVQCMLQRGQEVEKNPRDECFKDSSAKLNGSQQLQKKFLSNFGRCGHYVVCDYFDCATSGASGYGESQAEKIQYDCKADSDCRALSGNPDPDPAYAINSCVAFNTGKLESLTPDQRRAYESAFTMCAMMTACEFGSCFTF